MPSSAWIINLCLRLCYAAHDYMRMLCAVAQIMGFCFSCRASILKLIVCVAFLLIFFYKEGLEVFILFNLVNKRGCFPLTSLISFPYRLSVMIHLSFIILSIFVPENFTSAELSQRTGLCCARGTRQDVIIACRNEYRLHRVLIWDRWSQRRMPKC